MCPFEKQRSATRDAKGGAAFARAVPNPKEFWRFVSTWQNHLLYCSVYVGLLKHLWEVSLRSRPDGGAASWLLIIQYACMASIGALLNAEVSYMIKRRRLPPGDSGLPLIGHFFAKMRDYEQLFLRQFDRYGEIFTYCQLLRPMVVVTSDDDVRWANAMERKGKTRCSAMPHLVDLLGREAIMWKSGEAHRRLRKIFEPAFNPAAVRDYAPTIDRLAREQLEAWSASGEWQSSREWALLAMRIFFVCAFGEADEEKMRRLIRLFENWVAGSRALIPFPLPGTLLRRAHGHKDDLGREMKAMIRRFREEHPPGSPAARTSVMGRMCYADDGAGGAPTEDQLVENLRFFLVAGFDTTKGTFGALSQFVTEDPRIESALVEEVARLRGRPLDPDELKNGAPVLNAVMAETWRLTSPIAAHPAMATETLRYKGYVFPPGTRICADIQGHNVRNNDRYPDAARFHFERWLPADHPLHDARVANPEAIDYNVMNAKYRPFNVGMHACLGGHFAKLEVRIVMACLFRDYEVEIRNNHMKQFPVKQVLNEFRLTRRKNPVA